MNRILNSRRTVTALFAIICLTVLGFRGMDVAASIAAVAVAMVGSNAAQHLFRPKAGPEYQALMQEPTE